MKRYLTVLLFSLTTQAALAMSFSSTHLPTDLLFVGKPIDPLCFFNLEGNADIIELKKCGITQEKYSIVNQDNDFIKEGFYGFDWKDSSTESQGFSYYKAFPAGQNQYWIYSLNNGGGSGIFTEISLVKRKNFEILEIKKLLGGDRCNGGIQDVEEQQNRLRYTVNLTAYDLFALANMNPQHIKPYEDLPACAACCVAKAFYEMDLSLNPKFKYVELGEQSDSYAQGTYDKCFNKLLTSYVARHETKLDKAKLKQFVDEFNRSCKMIKAFNKQRTDS